MTFKLAVLGCSKTMYRYQMQIPLLVKIVRAPLLVPDHDRNGCSFNVSGKTKGWVLVDGISTIPSQYNGPAVNKTFTFTLP